MKVLFDVSHVAEGHTNELPHFKTGIYRVIDRLARGLARTQDCELRVCAPLKLSSIQGIAAYLRQVPELAHLPPALPLRRATLYHALAARRGRPGLLQRGFSKLMGGACRLLDLTRTMPGLSELAWADIFHTPCYTFPPGVRRNARLRKVVTVYDLIPALFPHFNPGDTMLRQLLSQWQGDDWAFCISQCTRNDLCEYLKLDGARTVVIPLAAAPELFYPVTEPERLAEVRRRHAIPEGQYMVGLSTLEPRKNIDYLIRSFVRLIRQQPELDLNLVLAGGEGWLFDKVSEAIVEAGDLRPRIILTGFVPDEDLAPLLSGATLFASMSLYEGFGLPLLEAMQCGTPVVASNVASHPEVVGDAGLLIAVDDQDALCGAILELCRNASLRAQLSQRSKERAAQFSWDRCIQRHIEAYRLVMESQG
jgi:glycosyltransferase involved in cell wall biosynthesis